MAIFSHISLPPVTPDGKGGLLATGAIVNADEETYELPGLEEADLVDDLDKLHNVYSTWFAKQRPEPSTRMVCKDHFYFTAFRAATKDHPAGLTYLLSQGMRLDRHLIKAAVQSGSIRV